MTTPQAPSILEKMVDAMRTIRPNISSSRRGNDNGIRNLGEFARAALSAIQSESKEVPTPEQPVGSSETNCAKAFEEWLWENRNESGICKYEYWCAGWDARKPERESIPPAPKQVAVAEER